MAISSYQTYLMYKTGGSWVNLVPIRTKPSLRDAPELLDTTTMSDANYTYIFGLQTTGAKEFQINYTKAAFTTISGLTGEQDLAVWFGDDGSGNPDGHNGKFTFKGYLSIAIDESNVNEVQTATITVAISSAITFA